MPKPLSELVAPDWAEALAPVEDNITAMGRFLREEIAGGHAYLPAGEHILRAFSRPMADVRVLILGQDPYPTPGHAMGLSFSVNPDVRPIPGSLRNIYRELETDLGIPQALHGDLTAWLEQGVLLLNRVLTVRPGAPASHRGKGWEEVTAAAVKALARRGGPPITPLRPERVLRLAPVQHSEPTSPGAGRRAHRLGTPPAGRLTPWMSAPRIPPTPPTTTSLMTTMNPARSTSNRSTWQRRSPRSPTPTRAPGVVRSGWWVAASAPT